MRPPSSTRRLNPRTLRLIRSVLGPQAPPASWEVVVVDTETTGIGPGARVVELAAVHARDGAVLREYQQLIHPGTKIPPSVTRIHGITDAMVRRMPQAHEVLPDFLAFVAATPLVAHNAAFDLRMLGRELDRAGIARPGLRVYCTVRLARGVVPGFGSYSLAPLVARLGLGVTPAHRALADARATLALLTALLARAPGEGLDALHGPARIL